MSQPKSGKFPIEPGQLLSTSLLIQALGISSNTLAEWRKMDLKFVDRSKLKSKSDFYWSDDVLSFIRRHGTDNGPKGGLSVAPVLRQFLRALEC